MNFVSVVSAEALAHHRLTRVVDEPSRFENAPVAIQLVGGTLEEEAVIAMGEVADAALKRFAAQ